MRTIIAVALIAAAGVAVARAETPDPDALDRFDRTGETASCISLRRLDITPIDDRTLLFDADGTFYLNETAGRCTKVDSNFTRIELRQFSNRICEGEILKVVHQANSTFVGSCSLGAFERLVEKSGQ